LLPISPAQRLAGAPKTSIIVITTDIYKMENILFIISPPIGGEIPPGVGPGESRSGVMKELPLPGLWKTIPLIWS
jgi:hypothetical protein